MTGFVFLCISLVWRALGSPRAKCPTVARAGGRHNTLCYTRDTIHFVRTETQYTVLTRDTVHCIRTETQYTVVEHRYNSLCYTRDTIHYIEQSLQNCNIWEGLVGVNSSGWNENSIAFFLLHSFIRLGSSHSVWFKKCSMPPTNSGWQG